MNKTIWKFELDPYRTEIRMPIGSEILTIQTQNGKPCIWALVYPAEKGELRQFEIYGTGDIITCQNSEGKTLRYIDTFQLDNGKLVFHVFERNPF